MEDIDEQHRSILASEQLRKLHCLSRPIKMTYEGVVHELCTGEMRNAYKYFIGK